MPQAAGTPQTPDASAPGQGFTRSIALLEAWLVALRAAPGRREWRWHQSCRTSTCRRGFYSRAGAAPMAEINSLLSPRARHSWQRQAESPVPESPRPPGILAGGSAWRTSGQGQAGWPAPGWQRCLPSGELARGLQSVLLPCQRVGGMGAPAVSSGSPGGSGPGAGCSCSAPAAVVPFPALQVEGARATSSWSRWVRRLSCLLPAQPRADQFCLPSRHASCKVWGMGARCSCGCWLEGHAPLLLTLPLSAQQISTGPEQEERSPALLDGTCTGSCSALLGWDRSLETRIWF